MNTVKVAMPVWQLLHPRLPRLYPRLESDDCSFFAPFFLKYKQTGANQTG
jgi:hypothetical protein